jgi:hypothetical protein
VVTHHHPIHHRHCEERSDAAIQFKKILQLFNWIATPSARNDVGYGLPRRFAPRTGMTQKNNQKILYILPRKILTYKFGLLICLYVNKFFVYIF